MTIRRIAGILLALVAAWLIWQGLQGIFLLTSRGSSLADAVDLFNLWRTLSAALVLIGGLMAAAGLRFGAAFALVGTLAFAALAVGFVLSGTGPGFWLDEVLGAAAMIPLSAVLLFRKRA